MDKPRKKRSFVILTITSVIMIALVLSDMVFTLNMKLADFLYQQERAADGQVAVIGIDQRALEALGPLPWGRDVMAEVIFALNEDENARPAVIGIDVLYAGEKGHEEDSLLVQAVAEGGNVVLAGAAVFGDEITVNEEGDLELEHFFVEAWDEPFEELKEVATVGHINAMFDKDGVIRHHLMWINTPSGEKVYSFGRKIYELYAEKMSLKTELPRTSENGFIYLPYTARPGVLYENVSVLDILSREVSGSDFEDRIVLIGPYDATLQDNYRTSISADENMFGVEIQGNVIEACINDNWYYEASRDLQSVLFILACLICIIIFASENIKRIILTWIVMGPGYIVVCVLAKKMGIILNPLYIPLTVTLLTVVAIALNYVSASIEKKRITQTFERYVAPSVVERLLKEGKASAKLGGELVDIAILFVDIRGFTPLSEALDPRQIVEILNEYLSLTTDCIMNTDGTLDKFVGDCTMAFWNAPLKQDDYVYKACATALEMVNRGKVLGDEIEKRYGKRVDFGIGVHCGSAVVGNIGAPQRMDFTAIGDTVNTAARLEANAPAGKIYISRAVADALQGRCQYISLGDTIKLKGKSEGFEVLELTSLL